MFERAFPPRHADAPFVSRFQAGEPPIGPGCHQVVTVKHGKIEELAGDLNAYGMQSLIFRTGATIAVPVKTGKGIGAAAFKFRSEDIGWHVANKRR